MKCGIKSKIGYLLLVLLLSVSSLSFSDEKETIEITIEQWQSLKIELLNLKTYYSENENLRKEREKEYQQRLNELNEREKDLTARESFLKVREQALTESTELSEKLREQIKALERSNFIWKILTIIGSIDTALNIADTAYSLLRPD